MKPFDLNHYSDAMADPMAFIDPTAILGDNVKVWHFSVVLAGVAIGDNVSIGSGCEIGRGSIIGKNTRIGAHVFIPPNTIIGENCFIGPNVVMCDDKNPRVNNPEYDAHPPKIDFGASIGAGVVILPGVTIQQGARIGAGAIVTRDVPSNALVYGERAVERMQKEFR